MYMCLKCGWETLEIENNPHKELLIRQRQGDNAYIDKIDWCPKCGVFQYFGEYQNKTKWGHCLEVQLERDPVESVVNTDWQDDVPSTSKASQRSLVTLRNMDIHQEAGIKVEQDSKAGQPLQALFIGNNWYNKLLDQFQDAGDELREASPFRNDLSYRKTWKSALPNVCQKVLQWRPCQCLAKHSKKKHSKRKSDEEGQEGDDHFNNDVAGKNNWLYERGRSRNHLKDKHDRAEPKHRQGCFDQQQGSQLEPENDTETIVVDELLEKMLVMLQKSSQEVDSTGDKLEVEMLLNPTTLEFEQSENPLETDQDKSLEEMTKRGENREPSRSEAAASKLCVALRLPGKRQRDRLRGLPEDLQMLPQDSNTPELKKLRDLPQELLTTVPSFSNLLIELFSIMQVVLQPRLEHIIFCPDDDCMRICYCLKFKDYITQYHSSLPVQNILLNIAEIFLLDTRKTLLNKVKSNIVYLVEVTNTNIHQDPLPVLLMSARLQASDATSDADQPQSSSSGNEILLIWLTCPKWGAVEITGNISVWPSGGQPISQSLKVQSNELYKTRSDEMLKNLYTSKKALALSIIDVNRLTNNGKYFMTIQVFFHR